MLDFPGAEGGHLDHRAQGTVYRATARSTVNGYSHSYYELMPAFYRISQGPLGLATTFSQRILF